MKRASIAALRPYRSVALAAALMAALLSLPAPTVEAAQQSKGAGCGRTDVPRVPGAGASTGRLPRWS